MSNDLYFTLNLRVSHEEMDLLRKLEKTGTGGTFVPNSREIELLREAEINGYIFIKPNGVAITEVGVALLNVVNDKPTTTAVVDRPKKPEYLN